MFPGPSPGTFLMPIYALIPAWPLPSSRSRVIEPQAPGLPQMSGQCLAHLGLSSEVLQLGWGRGCLPLLQFLLQGFLQAGSQSLCLEEAAIRQVICVCLGGVQGESDCCWASDPLYPQSHPWPLTPTSWHWKSRVLWPGRPDSCTVMDRTEL